MAGLLEGEGSFTLGAEGGRTSGPKVRQIQITCGMTDEDTIDKLHRTIGIGNVYKERRKDPRRAHAKQMYIFQASKRADVVPVMQAILPHMSERRSKRIQEILDYAEENPLIYNKPVICGTRRAYRKGCRCSECRAACAKYARDLRRSKAK